ncbi:hypothetical protein COHA_009205 [Chlorella ohadii]|uniref:Wax synthase domain-containing protein n=1 Tax=Chlorella ohadii TaxID=2649997 RepID=A0AAD5DIT3_9CHLO|nr:hypothetical protein COHA_009205 [Chlorella ohadii]
MPLCRRMLLMNIPVSPAAPGARRLVNLHSCLPTFCTAAALVAAHYALACCQLTGWPLWLLQCLLPYLFASTAMELPALALALLSGTPVAQPFNRPYLSTSIRHAACPATWEFWGRWNVGGSRRFRAAAYDPVLFGCAHGPAEAASSKEAVQVSQLRRWAAVFALFGLSGVIHELFFFYITRQSSGGWLLFFCLQAPLMLAEARLRQLAGQAGIHPPRLLKQTATLAVMCAVGLWLFIPGVMDLTRLFAEHFRTCHTYSFCSPARR